MDNKIIVVFSGGSHAGRSFASGLFLSGDIARIQEHITYLGFEEAMQNVREIMTATFNNVAEQFREMAENIKALGIFEKMESLVEMAEEIEKLYIIKEPLPRPHKIIPVFNVYWGYKKKLNCKPRYYHTRSNC